MFIDENKRRFLRIKYKTSDDISNLKELSRLIEEAIKREHHILSEEIESEKANRSQDEKDFLEGWYEDEFIQLQEEFPRLQRYALFTTVMSTIESNVVSLCKALQEIMKIIPHFEKSYNNILKKAVEYLEDHAGVDINCLLNYDDIDMFRRLRNCIVHSEGENTDKKPEEIEYYCKNFQTLTITQKNRILLSEGFISISLHLIQQFLDSLFEQSEKALENHTQNE